MLDGDDGASGDDGDAGERLASAYPEPDPEADLSDPESDLPNVPSPPSIEVPTPPTSESDVPEELLAGFWTTVLVFNVAVLATSVGLLVLALGSQRRLGAGALIVGLLAAVHGYWKYRSLSERHRSGEWTEESGDGEPRESEPEQSESRSEPERRAPETAHGEAEGETVRGESETVPKSGARDERNG